VVAFPIVPRTLLLTVLVARIFAVFNIRFVHSADGNISGLSAGDDRAWDLRFSRVR